MAKKSPWKWISFLVFGGCCCSCGLGGLFLANGIGQELAWLGASGRAMQRATVPRAEEMEVLRQIQGGEPLTPERLAKLEDVAKTMAGRTKDAAAELKAIPVPQRFTTLADLVQKRAVDMENRWLGMAGSIERRDLRALQKEIAETQALGDLVRQELSDELARLYPEGNVPSFRTGPIE
ncbi:MAG: hypothetical protein MUC92_13870 [Fimbriimonadaceae bacterium]|nr:hypothetical protein [Fimbriimonadaceae bacterium]